jgi:hypothetical protein
LVQVNPLGDGFPFPCQGLSTVEQVTSITAGQTQLVNFTGGAQHGGGSCQFSLTYDYPPPADKSKWKTIYTLIGGCPVTSAGNLPAAAPDGHGRADSPHCGGDTGVDCIKQFNIPIPKDVPNGNATFAWTWFNKIGNREIYMTCSPVAIIGGSDDHSFFNSLPQMFVANVAGECTTANGVLNIPNPGNFGKVLEDPTPGSEGSCPKAGGVPSFSGASSAAPAAPPAASSSPSSPPSPTTAPVEAPAASTSSGFITSTTTAAGGSSSSPATPTEHPGSSACSPDGSVQCMSVGFFALCDHGRAVPQLLAAGTTCENNQIIRKRARSFFH